MPATNKITVMPPGEGVAYWVAGMIHSLKINADDTGGAYSVGEVHVPPGCGAPLHTHHQEDEGLYMLEGELEFVVGDQTVRAEPGAVLHGPIHVRHAFTNKTDRPARMLFVFAPAGFERYFAEAGEQVTNPSGPAPEPDFQKLMDLAPKCGVELHLPGE